MRLAISNIAWDTAHDDAVAGLLRRHGVNAIDVAPGKYFPVPDQATSQAMQRVRQWWADRGIDITGMQALLFGTTGLNVFGDPSVQEALLQHLQAICRIGAALGAPRLVFGSPKNRDRTGLSDAQALAQGSAFFRRLGDIAAQQGVLVCLEPNPTAYGANFMVNVDEAAAVVRAVDHPAVRLQWDSGALFMQGDEPAAAMQRHSALVGHIHASEPQLVPLGEGHQDHDAMARAIAQALPHHVVSIEMLTAKDTDPLPAIDRALAYAVAHYRQPFEGAAL